MPRINRVNKARASKKERKCRECGHEIQPGESYKFARQRGGYPRFYTILKFWCKDHSPSRYEFIQNPKVETLMRAQDDLDEALGGDFEVGDVEGAAEAAAESMDELAEMQRESAQNIEDGFGHETEQSAEFNEKADAIEGIAEELRSYDVPEPPEEELGGEPEEPDEPVEPSMMDYEEDAEAEYKKALAAYEQEQEEYDEAYIEWESEQEAYDALSEQWENWRQEIRDDLGGILGNVET